MNRNLLKSIGYDIAELIGMFNGSADILQEILNKNAFGTNIKSLSSLVESLCFNNKEFIEKKGMLLTSVEASEKRTACYKTKMAEFNKALQRYEKVHAELCQYVAELNNHKELK